MHLIIQLEIRTNSALSTNNTASSINNAIAISSFQKTIVAGCFYDYFDKFPAWAIALQCIVLWSDYGIHANTKLISHDTAFSLASI